MSEKDTRPQWAIDAGIPAERLKNTTELEDYGPEPIGETFRTSIKDNTKRVYIDKFDMGFVRKVQTLPVITRVHMMGLTDKELESYIAAQKKYVLNWLIEILQKKWYWRESGDPIEVLPGMLPGTPLDISALLKQCQSKRPPTKVVIEGVIDWFVGDHQGRHSEVYLKEE